MHVDVIRSRVVGDRANRLLRRDHAALLRVPVPERDDDGVVLATRRLVNVRRDRSREPLELEAPAGLPPGDVGAWPDALADANAADTSSATPSASTEETDLPILTRIPPLYPKTSSRQIPPGAPQRRPAPRAPASPDGLGDPLPRDGPRVRQARAGSSRTGPPGIGARPVSAACSSLAG